MIDLIKIRLIIIKRNIWGMSIEKTVKLLTYLFVISVFLGTIFFVFFRIFTFLKNIEMFGESFTYKVFSIMFSMFFFLLMISSIISSISTFFRTSELEFLFATPIKIKNLFWVKLVENGFYASWATGIISIPLILSLGMAYNANGIFYLFSFSIYFLFILISTSLGLILVFLLSSFFLKYSKLSILIILLIVILSVLVLFGFSKGSVLFNLPKDKSLDEIYKYINTLEIEEFKYLPSGITSMSIFYFMKTHNWKMIFPLLYYIIPIVLLLIFMMNIYEEKYLSFESVKTENKKRNKKNELQRGLWGNKSIIAMFIKKDILLFKRDPSQWGQILIFFALLLFYVISLVKSPRFFKTAFYTYILAFANMAFASYIMATLSVRFIYPMISLEGRGFSMIMTYVGFKKFFNAKLIFNFVVSVIFGEILVMGTNMFLNLDTIVLFVSFVFIFIIAIGITFINIGIGALLPDFTEKNPSKIASGFGGIVSAIVSLVYVGVSLWIIGMPIRIYFENVFKGISFNNLYFVIALFIVGIVTIIISMIFYFFPIRKNSNHKDFQGD